MTRVVQSDYYKLTRRLFLGMFKQNMMLCALLFILTFVLLIASVNENSFVYAYETLMNNAGIRFIFLGGLAMMTLMIAYRIYADNFLSGGIYTTMMLPMPRRHVYLAYCTVGVASVLMLWTMQVIALTAAYLPVVARCQHMSTVYEKVNETVLPFSVARTNGLFLAVIRGSLWHILLPQSWQEVLSSLSTLLVLGVVPAYGILLSGARRAMMLLIPSAIAVAIWTLGCRLDLFQDGINMTAFVASMVLAALVTVVTVLDGVRRINIDANMIRR